MSKPNPNYDRSRFASTQQKLIINIWSLRFDNLFILLQIGVCLRRVIRHRHLIACFNVEVAEAKAREDWMVPLVGCIKEAISALKGSAFTFDLDFDPAVDPFPSNLNYFPCISLHHIHYFILVYLCFTRYYLMVFQILCLVEHFG